MRVRLLFDLDGTISDPAVGVARSINHALVHFGHAARREEDLHVYIGPPLDEAFPLLAGISSEDEVARYIAVYRERYFSVGYRENTLYAGIVDAFTSLSSAGILMAVCTSKPVGIAERVLEMFDVRRFFQFVDGGDVGVKKWQQIQRLKEKEWVDASTVMIGDRAVDIDAAHRNGLQGAGVLWGHGTREEIEAAGPEHLLSAPEDLKKLILN